MRLFIIVTIISISMLYAADNQQSDLPAISGKSLVTFNEEKFSLMQKANEQLQEEMAQQGSRKSGIKAAIMSGLIPGAGEVYAKSYWRAAIFFSIDAVLLYSNIKYNKKGDDEDSAMKAFGDKNWIEQKYWSKVYDEALEGSLWTGDPLSKKDAYIISDADYADPDVRAQLRELESKVGFTHTLPSSKTQQYYEMIYKYLHQFGVGWNDVAVLTNGDEVAAWNFYDLHDNLHTLSPNIEKYRSLRNQSNDYYSTATTMLNLMLLNHVLSAFDAALAVKQFNKKINYAIRVNTQNNGFEHVTTYGLYLSW